MLFALSLGILMGVFEKAPESVTGGTVRKTMAWIGGRGFVDPVPGADELRSAASRIPRSIPTSDLSGSSSEDSIDQGSVEGGEEGNSARVRMLDEDLVKSPAAI
jgi:hypothetical protein